jgi:protein-L-isoaspartate(D-aspartate) O-methyltransferase
MAIDGRKVSQLKVSCQVRAENVAAGPGEEQLPAVVISFYDERRAVIETASLGPWSGTFDWKEASDKFRVPLATREAIIRIGLAGATGRLELDDLQLHAIAPSK